jgi:excisionase family DNA binding protein
METATSTPPLQPAPITRHTKLEDLPELLTVREAATWLGVRPSLIRDLQWREELGVARIGRFVRIPKAALVALAQPGGAKRIATSKVTRTRRVQPRDGGGK